MTVFEDEPESTENTGRDPSRGGRPVGTTKLQPEDGTFKQINGLARLQCTQKEAAAVLGVHLNTFRSFLETHDSARTAWEDGHDQGKASLRRLQYKSASGGNASMQIWLGKQWLGQAEKAENTLQGPGGGPIPFAQVLGTLTQDVCPKADDDGDASTE